MSRRAPFFLLILTAVACDAPGETTGPGLDAPPRSEARVLGPPEILPYEFLSPTFSITCETFGGTVQHWSKETVWFWDYADGSSRMKNHDRSTDTYVNLVTGASFVVEYNATWDVRISPDHRVVSESLSGPIMRVRTNGTGPMIAYQIGREVHEVDWSTDPPRIERTFNGRAEGDYDRCRDLGDPLPGG